MIRVHVERLILEGVELNSIERVRFERSLISELTRLLEAPGSASSIANHGRLASLDAGGIRLIQGESGHAAGARVARSVFASLTQVGNAVKSDSIAASKSARGQLP